ncbi:MAG: ABC transporter permease subunit [Christensenellales bacterium]
MFRLFKAELKKIFLKPSIFVVTGLIILMLAISTFLYNPQAKSDFVVNYNSFSTTISNDCDTVSEVYENFTSNNFKTYSIQQINQLLTNAENYINYYVENNDNLSLIKSKYQSVYSSCTSYQRTFEIYKNAKENNQDLTTIKTNLDNARNKFFSEFEGFYDLYKKIVNNEQTTVLVTETLDKTIYNFYCKFDETNYTRYEASLEYYANNESYLNKLFPSTEGAYFLDTLNGYVEQLIPFEVDADIFDNLKSYLTSAKEWLGNDGENGEEMTGIYKEIYDFYDRYKTSDNPAYTKDIITMVTNYNIVANYASNIVTKSIQVNGLQKLGATNIQQYAPFKNSNLYEMKEKLTKTIYLFDNHQFEYEYADVFSINQPSNTDINGFDYSYFAVRLCTLFIIVYIVVLAAGTIAGEQSAGTMKLLAIRPFNRNKLLAGKLLAILAIGGILLSVSSVATLVIGGINYGFASAPILMVFNATKASVISPVLLYLIALLTMFVEISFYALLSTFISTVFKSNIGAVTVSILLFFASLVLNVIAVNVPWLRFLPFTNINLFKYFGASFVSTNSAQNVLQGILTPTVFVGADFWLSFAFTTISIALLCVVSFVKFKKQDIK